MNLKPLLEIAFESNSYNYYMDQTDEVFVNLA